MILKKYTSKDMHRFNPENAHKLDSEERHNLLPPHKILTEIGIKPGMRIADIGCGTGFFTVPAAEILGDDGQVYAFDVEKKMLTYLRMKIEKPNIVPILVEEDKLLLKDKLLDFALLAFVLHEIQSPKTYLNEVKRILKQKGNLAIIDWIKQDEEHGPPKSERIDQNDLANEFKELNIKILKSEKLNASHYVVVGEVDH